MTCEEALELLSGHMDRENTPEEEAMLRSHLDHCPQCRQLLEAFLEIDSGVAALTAEPPAGLREDVMAAVRAEAAPKKKRTSWTGLAVAAALALVLGVGSLGLTGNQGKDAAAPATASTVARSLTTADTAAAAEAPMEYTASAQAKYAARADVLAVDPQALAEERQADVAVTQDLLPEMEVCPCETLEDGSLLYQLAEADGAVKLSRIYGVALYQPADGANAEVSYALLVKNE